MMNINFFLKNMRNLVFITGIFFLLSGCEGSPVGTNEYLPAESSQKDSIEANSYDFESSEKYPTGFNLPKIIVETPENGTIIDDYKEITVTGSVEQGDNPVTGFMVNGKDLEIESDGTFNTTILLPDDGSRFAGIELTAKDSHGYWKREYVTILRGESVSTKEYIQDAIGISPGQGMTEWVVDSISPVVNEVFSREDLMGMVSNTVSGVSFSISPLALAGLSYGPQLTVKGVTALDYSEFRINSLTIKEPPYKTGSSAGLIVEFSLKGLEIDAVFKMKTPFGIFKKDIKITITDRVDILSELRLNAPDPHTIKIDIADIDVAISEVAISTDILEFGDQSINIKGAVSPVISFVLSELLDIMLDDVLIPMPEDPVNLGMINHILDKLSIPIDKRGKSLNIGAIIDADFSDMYLAYGIGGFSGNLNQIRVSLDLTAWGKNHNEVINIPPAISIDEALISSPEIVPDLAIAVSENFMNRMLGALTGIEPEIFIPGEEIISVLLPGVELPDETGIKIRINTPPVLEFKDAKGMISAVNIRVEFYMGSLDESGLQACMAFNIKANIKTDVFFKDGKFYLDFDLLLPKVEVVYLLDRIGVSRILNMEDVIGTIAPQLIDILKKILNVPLRISVNEISGLLPNIPLPETTTIAVQKIRMEDGYVSLFVNMEK